MLSLKNPNSFKIIYNPDLKILEVAWHHYSGTKDLQDAYWKLADEMRARQVCSVLIDIRERGEVPYADQVWLCQEYLPTIISRIHKQIKLAYVVSPEHYEVLQSESPNGFMETLSELLALNFFIEQPKAVQWLAATY